MLLLQLNPMLGTAPNISLETTVIIKLLLKSYGSQVAQDGLSGSGTHLKPITSSSPTEISHWQHSTSHCPQLGAWPLENIGKASSIFLLPQTSLLTTTTGHQLPALTNNPRKIWTTTDEVKSFLPILQTSPRTLSPIPTLTEFVIASE